MIRMKPMGVHESRCPYCGGSTEVGDVLWQGIHVCVNTRCPSCSCELIEDLRTGHAINAPYQVDVRAGRLFGPELSRRWLGEPLLASLLRPSALREVELTVESFRECQEVIVLNCLDFCYGHSLLRLLNAQHHLENDRRYGLVVLVPRALRWMVPSGVAEVWSVDIAWSEAREFFPDLDRKIHSECARFSQVFLSRAHAHPRDFDIAFFTGVSRHDFDSTELLVTCVWREDRPWLKSDFITRACRHLPIRLPLLWSQNWKVRRLFRGLRKRLPGARFSVAGLGVSTCFPGWVEDERVACYAPGLERRLCEVYSRSRLVVGVHGSHMLLPTGHAGMSVVLMPKSRWRNMANDVLYHEPDSRMAAYRYRYIPTTTDMGTLVRMIVDQLEGCDHFRRQVQNEV